MGNGTTTSHRLWMIDARDLQGIDDRSVDLVVTSPPYPMIEMWDDAFEAADPLIGEAIKQANGAVAFERMHQCLDPVWRSLTRVLKPGGIACINIGDATRTIDGHFQLFANHSRVISSITASGLEQLPTILWRKPTNAPTKFMGSGMLPPSAYVTLEHEYILIFRNGPKRSLARDDEKQLRRSSAYFWEERNVWFSDIWLDLRGTAQILAQDGHRRRSGAFPLELPFRLINMFSLKGDMVLDPFLGTGTTMLAAMCACRNSCGYESDASLHPVILEKISNAYETSSLLVRERLQSHTIFVHERTKLKGPLKYFNPHHGAPVMTQQEEALCLETIENLHYVSNDRFKVRYNSPIEKKGEVQEPAEEDTGNAWPRRGPRGRQLKIF